MCIRDSLRDDQEILARFSRGEQALSVARGHGPIARAVDDPVSYTHLRAHETVLDLVCRLLLEKKKTTTNEHAKKTHETLNRTQT